MREAITLLLGFPGIPVGPRLAIVVRPDRARAQDVKLSTPSRETAKEQKSLNAKPLRRKGTEQPQR
jgi:hypothetical protein